MIETLYRGLTIQEIMVVSNQLERAGDHHAAEKLHNHYDVVPCPQTGPITGFFRRGSTELQRIETGTLLSHGTSLLELPKLLVQNPFYFVIAGNEIVGYIHYSDLNKTIVKIPFFALLISVERAIWERIEGRICERDLNDCFKEGEAKKFISRRKKNVENNLDVGWVGVFSFPSILKLANYYGVIQLNEEQISLLREYRNRTAHSDWKLVTKHGDVQRLVDVIDLAQSLIAPV